MLFKDNIYRVVAYSKEKNVYYCRGFLSTEEAQRIVAHGETKYKQPWIEKMVNGNWRKHVC